MRKRVLLTAVKYQRKVDERGITGIMFCHQTGGPSITGWPYKREGL